MSAGVTYTISNLGTRAIRIQVAQQPSHKLLQWLLIKKNKLRAVLKTEVLHTYNEILVKLDKEPKNEERRGICTIIKEILDQKDDFKTASLPKKTHYIPVCYEGRYAPDIEAYAKAVQLPIAQIIKYHTEPVYTIYFIGFLPGFPYLLGLDKRLSLSRKESPTRSVPAGGIAIGGSQTGIYPQQSPGGWYVIGQTSTHLFNPKLQNPSPFNAGDQLKFIKMSISHFEQTNNNLTDG